MNPLSAIRRARHILLQLKGYGVFRRRVAVYGDFTVVNPANVTIGTGCAINHNVFILGHHRVVIGNGVILSAGAMLLDSSLAVEGFTQGEHHYPDGSITIEDGAWIGAGSIVLPNVTVGRKSIVGAGSVVTKDVEPLTVVAGNPARLVRRLEG